MSYEKEIFKGKTLGDLFEDIYKNSRESKQKSREVIDNLLEKVETLKDSLLVVPVIKDFLDLGVKNDDLLVKIATIIQRHESAQLKANDDDGDIMNDPEMQKLLENIEKSNNSGNVK